eukprot:m.58828 g.58828  ORF g.58828 m.58828 type:complete len:182 (+) comp19048_c0_seq7:101-646(+)
MDCWVQWIFFKLGHEVRHSNACSCLSHLFLAWFSLFFRESDQIAAEVNDCRAALQKTKADRRRKEKNEENRRKLLDRTFEANEDTTINIDHELDFQDRLSSTNQRLGSIIDNATASLMDLQDQGRVLKRVRTSLLNVANTLGLSHSVMRYIENRGLQDKYIFFVGAFLTLLIMFLMYYYFG